MSQEPELAQEPVEEEEKKPSLLHSVLEFVVIIIAAIAIAAGLTTFVVKPYQVPSGSMLETIQLGDRVLSEKITYYTRSPQYGDIVTFIDPEDSSRTLIKRCIATAGQTVDLKDGVVYIDGQALSESSYTLGKPSYPLNSSITYPYTVPDGCIWCMGDNRTDSADSRYFGPVPLENVTGHAFFVYWPLEDIGLLK